MKIKTRLQVTFLTIIILPILLTVAAFGIIGNILAKMNGQAEAVGIDPMGPKMDVLFTPQVARSLFFWMAVSILLILVVTSVVLTMWIKKGLYNPVKNLNIAMQHIAEGNLEYRLPESEEG